MPNASVASATILLVDDTDLLREVIGEQLRELASELLVASGGKEALRVANAHPAPIHLLLTDLNMPGMRGGELAVLLRARHPETKVLFMSGSGPEAMADPEVVEAGGEVLEKPFGQEALAKALEHALNR